MNILDTRAYRWAQTATDFFLLNLLWLLASVLIVTAFPATAAMFAVVRDWVREKEGGVFGAFVFRFRQNFWQSLVVGVVWALFAGALLLDFVITNGLSGGAQVVMRSLLVLASVLFALSSVFLFPVMVHYDTKWTAVPKNALLLAIGRLPTTVGCLVTVAAMGALTFLVPPLILITGSLTAYAVYRLCDREFRKIDASQR
jgi:uncharacterized membrane protein YesL